MPAGRPRTVSPPPEELEALGMEMIDWLETTEIDFLHVSDWYSLHKGFTDKAWETMTDRSEFIPYYNKALKIVGRKYLAKDSPIEPSLKQRWQRVYFKDLRKEEDQTADDNVKREHEALRNKENALPTLDLKVTVENQKMIIDHLNEKLKDYESRNVCDQSEAESELRGSNTPI